MEYFTKKALKFAVLFFCCLFAVSCAKRHYILFTKDYGILDQQDLDFEAEFAPMDQTAEYLPAFYHAWQCFPLEDYKIFCGARTTVVTREMIEKHEPVGQVFLKIIQKDTVLEFSTKRPYEFDTCFEIESEWKDIFGQEQYGCVAGEHLSDKRVPDGSGDLMESYWEIRQLKSKSGYWSYFSKQNHGPVGDGR